MSKTNRNDPCPCGSGKKYKKCCLTADSDIDFRYRRWQRTESDLIPRLMDFAFESLGREVLTDAWKEFTDDDEDEFDPEHPMNMVFMPWCFFTWRAELHPLGSTDYIESTIAELFIRDNEDSLTRDEKTLLLNYVKRPFSLCEIVEVNPGVGMTQFDLLRRVKYDVLEREASRALKRGEIIFCATAELEGISFNFGTSPLPLRPIDKSEILRFRKWLLEQKDNKAITSEDLQEFADDIRILYINLMSDMLVPPSLTTTDGDAWVPHKILFKLESADKAFYELKDLAEGSSESDLLSDAVIKKGRVTKVEIPWLGGKEEARTRLGGAVLLGLLKIDGKRLVAEVNSVSRADAVRKLIEDRCKGNATYKTTLIEPLDSDIQEMWNAAAGQSSQDQSSARTTNRSSSPAALKLKTIFRWDDDEFIDSEFSDGAAVNSSDDSFAGSDSPAEQENDAELRAAMQALAKRHWETWLDLPVPALNDLTPREASQTEEGRDLLESLLLHFENLASPDEPFDPNTAELRQKLGIE